MELKELMQTSVENLAEKQHDKLKQHVLNIINKLELYIDNEQYDKVEDMTFSSPAGDGYGLDNNCINFDYGNKNQYREGILDIMEVVEDLQNLKEKSQ